MKPPIFIVGTQRSGTTLLCRMLTSHPNIFIKNESPDICSIFAKQNSKKQVLDRINDLIQETYNISLEELLKKSEKRRWGIKDPRLTYCLNCLIYYFPNIKIIFIIRDGRAVTNSNIRNKWGIATNSYYGAKLWKKEIRIQREFIEKNPDKCHLVKYEELIYDPESNLKKICVFLEEEFSEHMLYYYKKPSHISKTKYNENVFGKINTDMASKWKKELSPRQIAIFESIAGDELERNHYELIGKKIKISQPLRLLLYLQQKILGELQLQYQLRLKHFGKGKKKCLEVIG